jgi:diguanylate cyclase (GGDEF)-like protein/PAS domain S-box-containing protein
MVYRAIFAAGVQDPYRRLSNETALLRSLIDSVPDLISFTDQDGRLLGANRAFSGRFGLDPEDVVGRTPIDVAWQARQERTMLPRLSDDVQRFEETLHDPSGVVQHYDTLQTPYFTEDGTRLGIIEISRDMTAQRAAEERIHQLALYDHLTGLPNRALIGDAANATFADPSSAGRAHALVFLDLDDFKTINDTVGHRVGDLIIQETAARLVTVAGSGVTVARLGGDEFALLLPATSLEQAAALVRSILASIERPYRIEQYELALTASAGLAMYPTDGTTFEDLAVRADAAMYRAKQDGRHTFRFYSGDMLAKAAERLDFLTSLRRAVEQDELVLHYQPQVSLVDGRIVGVEALVRWQHPQLGLLGPDAFIALAEDSGMILPIGEWVLNRALADAAHWQREEDRPFTVSVNLSAVQFVQTDLAERVRRALLRAEFPPELLELEITESVAMASPEMAIATVDRLHTMGIRISIDDFGTGYSSLAYLKRFRIDELKIDRSFVTDLGKDPGDEAIVTAIIQVAKSLRCSTVAEGVETHAQEEFLRAHGCDIAQGFHLYRPMPAEDVQLLLDQPVRETT